MTLLNWFHVAVNRIGLSGDRLFGLGRRCRASRVILLIFGGRIVRIRSLMRLLLAMKY